MSYRANASIFSRCRFGAELEYSRRTNLAVGLVVGFGGGITVVAIFIIACVRRKRRVNPAHDKRFPSVEKSSITATEVMIVVPVEPGVFSTTNAHYTRPH
jgi:hypothetical protein